MPTSQKKTLQPRKRPAQARSAETVAVILAAAAHILEKGGFDGYSTNGIASRAGVSIGSLYQYFPGKDAITIALIQQESARLAASIKEASLIDDWQEALRAMIDVAARYQLARPTLVRLLDIEEARLGPESSAEEIVALVERVLRREWRNAEPTGPRTWAVDVVAIVRGLTDMAAGEDDLTREALRHRLDCAVFGYLSLACRAAG